MDIGLAADLGTLTRVPRITGNDSLLRELCYTGRNFSSADAQALGLVSRVLPSPADTLAAAEALAAEIAGKSPVAVVGTKANLRYARDHTTRDALDYITTWCVVVVESMLVGVVVCLRLDLAGVLTPPVSWIVDRNAAALQTEDVERSVVAAMSKAKAEFSKL